MSSTIKFHPRLAHIVEEFKLTIGIDDVEEFERFERSVHDLGTRGGACLSCSHAGFFLYKFTVSEEERKKGGRQYSFSWEMALCSRWTTAVSNSSRFDGNLPIFCSVHSEIENHDSGNGSVEHAVPENLNTAFIEFNTNNDKHGTALEFFARKNKTEG